MASKVTSTWKGPQVLASMQRAGEQLVFRAAHMHRNECIRLILEGEKSGHVYGAREHQASAPGEAPASDYGRLVQGIHVKHEPNSLTALVVVGSKYGRMLELGTRTMAPRPFLSPAGVNVRPAIDALAQKLSGEAK